MIVWWRSSFNLAWTQANIAAGVISSSRALVAVPAAHKCEPAPGCRWDFG